MVERVEAWCLERNDRRLAFASSHDVTVFAESGPAAATWHRHPAWKIVLPMGGRVVGAPRVGGLLVPPQLAHTCATSSAFVAIFLQPWRVRPGLGLTWLEPAIVRRLLASLGDGLDLAALQDELTTAIGAPPAVDPRVTYAVRACGRVGRLDALAAEVELSSSRLRALVRSTVGVPLSRMRQWQRLRNAMAELPFTSLAETAVSAGFADQAHLTRLTRRLVGRSPASLRLG